MDSLEGVKFRPTGAYRIPKQGEYYFCDRHDELMRRGEGLWTKGAVFICELYDEQAIPQVLTGSTYMLQAVTHSGHVVETVTSTDYKKLESLLGGEKTLSSLAKDYARVSIVQELVRIEFPNTVGTKDESS